MTPDQQAAIDQTASQMDLSTKGTYSNLGLGGSTMETQDTNANKQKSLAQTASFANLDEMAGLQGLQEALGYQGEGLTSLLDAGQILSGATGALTGAGGLGATEQQTQLGLLGSLGSSLGGITGKGGAGSNSSLF